MVQTLHSISSASVAVVDPNPEKIKQARDLGAHISWVVPRKGNTLRVDRQIHEWSLVGPQVVIDTTGNPEAIKRALQWVGLAGQVILFGVPDPASRMIIQPEIIFKKELNIQAVVGMTTASFHSAFNLLQSHTIDPSAQATVYIDLDQLPQNLEDQSLNKKAKVIVRFSMTTNGNHGKS
jgi:threonine dehydrogenase-like Zn-dependent dehydrogenase